MPINDNISDFIRRYKEERHLSMSELAEEWGIPKSSLEKYMNGSGNPRADTLELLAKKCDVSVSEIISAHSLGWERAEIAEQAARLFGDLPLERRNRAVKLFLALVDELSEKDDT